MGHVANPFTAGLIVGTSAALVDYTPWLGGGGDTSAAPGFQGNFSTLFVDDDSPQTSGGRIQEGIDLATAGGTVNVLAGTYPENVIINKRITLQGAGSGGTAADTIIAPAGGNGIDLQASGLSTAEPVVIRDLRVQGATNGIYTDSAISHVTLDNVDSVNNTSAGVEIHNAANVQDLVLNGVTLSGNQVGFRVATTGVVNGLTVTGGHFDNNTYGLYTNASSASSTNEAGFTNVVINGTTFDNNANKGIYVEKLDHALIENVTVDASGVSGASAAGIDVNLKYGNYADLTLQNVTVTDSGTGDAVNGVGVTIKGRDDAPTYNTNPASLTGVTLDAVSITGSPTDLALGNNVTGITMTGVSLGGTGRGLVSFLTAPQTLDIGNTSFTDSLANFITNVSPDPIDATGATFGTLNKAVLADNFAIEDKVFHALDQSGLGLVTWNPGNLYVTLNSGSIQRGVDAASAGDTVNVGPGTFHEDVNVNKTVTLLGQGPAQTTVSGADRRRHLHVPRHRQQRRDRRLHHHPRRQQPDRVERPQPQLGRRRRSRGRPITGMLRSRQPHHRQPHRRSTSTTATATRSATTSSTTTAPA